MLSLSPSKITTFLECPFKYECDCDTETRKKYKRESAPLVFGNLIHGTLNDYFKRTAKEARSMQRLRDLFKEKFNKNLAKHERIFGDKKTITEYVLRARAMFENFMNGEFASVEPFITEEFPRYHLNPDLELSGKYDRIDNLDGQLTVVDYKTGKIREEAIDSFQLDFYELLLGYIYPDFSVKRKVFYFLDENQVTEIPVKGEDVIGIKERILEVADKIRLTKEFKPKQNDTCRFCDYQPICPLMKKGVASNNG